jgi:uncharacterized protein YukE
MDKEDKMYISQIIDNQNILNKKMDNLIKIVSDLANTIMKYDQQYQNDIASGKI